MSEQFTHALHGPGQTRDRLHVEPLVDDQVVASPAFVESLERRDSLRAVDVGEDRQRRQPVGHVPAIAHLGEDPVEIDGLAGGREIGETEVAQTPLLEIVRGKETSAEVLRSVLYLSTIMRKIGVVVGNSPGFAANRTLEGYGRESEFLVLEGARPEDVDRALTGFGFPMGPCAMGDMAGLDIRSDYLAALRDAQLIPADPRYGALTKALVAAGRLGQKTAAGNYDYGPDGRTPVPSARALEIRDRVAAELGVPQRTFTDEEIVMRCLLPVVVEAARVLAEGVVPRASDIDVLWVYGYGFPAAKGGPVYLARQLGLDAVRQGIAAQRRADPQFGDRYWAPSAPLELLFA